MRHLMESDWHALLRLARFLHVQSHHTGQDTEFNRLVVVDRVYRRTQLERLVGY